ncbi:MAG: hypothetical protein EAZ71_05470 [Verrucomicrobia bacterium]|nr:MAG: hypothetical protein EAZ82_05905 [Verrucomicrobiota bacterium]TAF26256.1 MAG: hypothetical protein EAZ71_05470 [Verrucomicrobiota bacterium]
MRFQRFQHSLDGGGFRCSDGRNSKKGDRSNPDRTHLGDFKGGLTAVTHGSVGEEVGGNP